MVSIAATKSTKVRWIDWSIGFLDLTTLSVPHGLYIETPWGQMGWKGRASAGLAGCRLYIEMSRCCLSTPGGVLIIVSILHPCQRHVKRLDHISPSISLNTVLHPTRPNSEKNRKTSCCAKTQHIQFRIGCRFKGGNNIFGSTWYATDFRRFYFLAGFQNFVFSLPDLCRPWRWLSTAFEVSLCHRRNLCRPVTHLEFLPFSPGKMIRSIDRQKSTLCFY